MHTNRRTHYKSRPSGTDPSVILMLVVFVVALVSFCVVWLVIGMADAAKGLR